MQKEFIETERLILRKFREDDALLMFTNWANDPEVTKYMTWNPHPNVEVTKQTLNMWLKEYEKPNTNRYTITIKGNDEPLGSIDVVEVKDGIPEVGYCIAKKCWNQGYMSEAVKAFLKDIMNDYDKVCICAHKDNIGSNRVIQKCGGKFIKQFETTLKDEPVLVNYYIIEK